MISVISHELRNPVSAIIQVSFEPQSLLSRRTLLD